MVKKVLIVFIGLLCGILSVFYILKHYFRFSPQVNRLLTPLGIQQTSVLGFLPYWLVNKDEKDYSPYVNSLGYFSLTVDEDGSIQKRTNPVETEPGWLALQSGKMDTVFDTARKQDLNLSLVIFSGDQDTIGNLIADPVTHAQTLTESVIPILNGRRFTDLNIDIESVSIASDSARQNFTTFIKTIHDQIQKQKNPISLSIDVSPTALIRPYLIDVPAISQYIDKAIFMTYDFHYPGSSVTGAVSPVNGAGTTAEFDAETSIKEALKILPPDKILLGVPLYGYEWETLSNRPHTAVIPGTGIIASNKRVEEFLSSCATCSAQFDPVSKESYLVYKDQDTGTFHQLFYPDAQSVQEKINLMQKYRLGGIALWALGYEGSSILEPLKSIR